VNTVLLLNFAWVFGVGLVALSFLDLVPQPVGWVGAAITLAALFVGWRLRKSEGDADEGGRPD
jgi:hypothetical protein